MSESVTQAPALPSTIVKVLGGLRRRGRFALQARTRVVTLIGGIDLDLTEAVLPASGARLTNVSAIGGISLSPGRCGRRGACASRARSQSGYSSLR